MKKKCQGIAGLLFGHKYEPVFQEDRVMYPAKEMAEILKENSNESAPNKENIKQYRIHCWQLW